MVSTSNGTTPVDALKVEISEKMEHDDFSNSNPIRLMVYYSPPIKDSVYTWMITNWEENRCV